MVVVCGRVEQQDLVVMCCFTYLVEDSGGESLCLSFLTVILFSFYIAVLAYIQIMYSVHPMHVHMCVCMYLCTYD